MQECSIKSCCCSYILFFGRKLQPKALLASALYLCKYSANFWRHSQGKLQGENKIFENSTRCTYTGRMQSLWTWTDVIGLLLSICSRKQICAIPSYSCVVMNYFSDIGMRKTTRFISVLSMQGRALYKLYATQRGKWVYIKVIVFIQRHYRIKIFRAGNRILKKTTKENCTVVARDTSRQWILSNGKTFVIASRHSSSYPRKKSLHSAVCFF